jgi:hypothetical protein
LHCQSALLRINFNNNFLQTEVKQIINISVALGKINQKVCLPSSLRAMNTAEAEFPLTGRGSPVYDESLRL